MIGSVRGCSSAGTRSSFVGREAELDLLLDLVAPGSGVRIVTITGVPGVGKTRLARELCAATAAAHGVDSAFVALAEVSDARSIPAHVAAARQPGRASDAALGTVVLDNVEHLPGASAEITRLLDDASDVTLLVTSTSSLRLAGERVLALGPLDSHGSEAGEPAAGVRLFADRAAAADVRFALTADTVPVVAQLCSALGGLPLAIELAAARVPFLAPSGLLTQLRAGAGLDLLRQAHPVGSTRHRSMRDALSWSHDLLPPGARELLARLSVFAGSFSLAAAVAVARPDTTAADLFDLLSVLVDTRLVEPCHDRADPPRFELGPLVRMFARERCPARDRRQSEDRHTLFVCALARTAGRAFDGGRLADASVALEPEWPEITAVLDRLVSRQAVVDGLQLAIDCAPFHMSVGYDPAMRSRVETLLAARDDAVPDALLARALSWSVLIARQGADHADHAFWAQARLSEALAAARRAGDPVTTLLVLELTFLSFPVTGNLRLATDAVAEGLELAKTHGEDRRIARFEAWSAMIAHQLGDIPTAVGQATRSLARARRRGDDKATLQAALAVMGLGEADPAPVLPALPPMGELRRMCREIRDHQAETYLLTLDAGRLLAAGDADGAARRCAESLTLVARLGGTGSLNSALTIALLVVIAVRRGEHECAGRLHGSVRRSDPSITAASTPWKGQVYRAAVATTRQRLGDTAFEVAVAAGAELLAGAALDAARSFAESVARGGVPATVAKTAPPVPLTLTPRELDVLRALATGSTNKAIAAQAGAEPEDRHALLLHRVPQAAGSGTRRGHSMGVPQPGGARLMWNGLSTPGLEAVAGRFLACDLRFLSRRRGPRGQHGAPAAKRGRTVLRPGWRLLPPPPVVLGWGGAHAPGRVRWAVRQTDVRESRSQVGDAQGVAPH